MPDGTPTFDWVGLVQSTGLAGLIGLILIWLARQAVIGFQTLWATLSPPAVKALEEHATMMRTLKTNSEIQTETLRELCKTNGTETSVLFDLANAADELADEDKKKSVRIHTDQMRRKLGGK